MSSTRIRLLELGRQRLKTRGLSNEMLEEYMRHVQGYLRFYNEPQQSKRLATRDAAAAVDAYLAWLERETQASPESLRTARSAIELLYSDVFRIPISRS